MNTFQVLGNSLRTPSSRRVVCFASIATATLVALSGSIFAGPLNPPTSAVSSTYKTLDEVEPRIIINQTNTPGDPGAVFLITQPGSYYLTGNVIGQAGKTGIRIKASCVKLDLMGFHVIGVAGAVNGIDCAVAINPSIRNVEVCNGCVRGWQNGIDLSSTTATNVIIDDIRASDNSIHGIAAGNGSLITKCVAFANGTTGTLTFGGIYCGSYGTIIGCTSYNNGGDGIFANTGCTVVDCNLSQNLGAGIQITTNCTVRGNTCIENGFGGGPVTANILAGLANGSIGNNRIDGNTCTGADNGIQVASTGNFIVRNICSHNTTNNWLINPGNAVGPIQVAITNAALIPGNSYGAAGVLGPASTDPNCNFTY